MFLSTLQLQEWAGVGLIYFSKVSQGKELFVDIKEIHTFSLCKVVSQREVVMESSFS